jgi:hypothetical protein
MKGKKKLSKMIEPSPILRIPLENLANESKDEIDSLV